MEDNVVTTVEVTTDSAHGNNTTSCSESESESNSTRPDHAPKKYAL